MIYITKEDYQQLSLLTANQPRAEGRANLRDELAQATVLPRDQFPAGIVAMNTQVRFIDLDSNETEEYTITLPQHADAEARRLSVLSPIGTALLGYREGDELTWPTPGGLRRLRILDAKPGEEIAERDPAQDFLARLLHSAPATKPNPRL